MTSEIERHRADEQRPQVHGPTVDTETRCVHYASELDVVAITFKCCGRYYPCFRCHAESETHAAIVWPVAERSTDAVLCGACGTEMSIDVYLDVDRCPSCSAPFNPGCRLHAHYYFELA